MSPYTDTGSVVKDMPEISRKAQELGADIDEMGQTIDVLVKRLAPVLSPVRAKDDEKGVNALPAVSPLADTLRSLDIKITLLNYILKTVIDQLEI